MITYIFTDITNKQHSIAEYDGVEVKYWNSLFSSHPREEVEAYIKAEALLKLGRKEEINSIIQPFISGENTVQVSNVAVVNEDGTPSLTEEGIQLFKTMINGSDSRSFLKNWSDNNLY